MNPKLKNFFRRSLFLSGIILTFLIGNTADAANTHSVVLESDSSQFLSKSSANNLRLKNDFTLEGWFNLESLPANDSRFWLIDKKSESGEDYSIYALFIDNTSGAYSLRLRTTNGNSTSYLDSSVSWTPATSTWYHIAVTREDASGEVKFYVNGVQQGVTQSGATGTLSDDSDLGFYIGRYRASDPRYFDGMIDDVRIWSLVRTGLEISDDKSRELNGNETGLVAYWKFNSDLNDTTNSDIDLTYNPSSSSYSTSLPFEGFTELLKVRKTIDESRTSSTTLVSDSHLKLSLAANKSYIVDGVVFVTTTSNKDISISFNSPTNSEIMLGYTDNQAVADSVLSSGATSTPIDIPTGRPTTIHIRGTIKTNETSGDFFLKWAQATGGGSITTTVKKGSYLRAEEI